MKVIQEDEGRLANRLEPAKRQVEVRRAGVETGQAGASRRIEGSRGAQASKGFADDSKRKVCLHCLAASETDGEPLRLFASPQQHAGLAEPRLPDHEERLPLAGARSLEHQPNRRQYSFPFVQVGSRRILVLARKPVFRR